MFCPACGTAFPESARFCPGCGGSVNGTPNAASSCVRCGTQLPSGASFCKNCGTGQRKSVPATTPSPESIRAELRRYDKHISLICLECGYNGLMGVVKTTVPWYFSYWVLVPLFLTGIGLLPALILGILAGLSQKCTTVCPACKRTLHQTS